MYKTDNKIINLHSHQIQKKRRAVLRQSLNWRTSVIPAVSLIAVMLFLVVSHHFVPHPNPTGPMDAFQTLGYQALFLLCMLLCYRSLWPCLLLGVILLVLTALSFAHFLPFQIAGITITKLLLYLLIASGSTLAIFGFKVLFADNGYVDE